MIASKDIDILKEQFVQQLNPIKVILFGSYAKGTNTEDSDLDFYVVVNDDVTDIAEETTKAYKAIRGMREVPVDIVVGTYSRYEKRKNLPTLEKEVENTGVVLYG